MKLIVGLGNPGRKYEGTRHNVGFLVLDDLAKRHQAAKPRAAFQGEVAEISLENQRALLLWPHTFMNASGGSVLAARDFYKLANDDVLVICDDFNLPLAKLRVRSAGSAGGQKGLMDIIRRLGGEEIARLRIGVGTPPPKFDPADFVLSRFKKDEEPEIMSAIWRAADAVAVWASDGIDVCMNRFNRDQP